MPGTEALAHAHRAITYSASMSSIRTSRLSTRRVPSIVPTLRDGSDFPRAASRLIRREAQARDEVIDSTTTRIGRRQRRLGHRDRGSWRAEHARHQVIDGRVEFSGLDHEIREAEGGG